MKAKELTTERLILKRLTLNHLSKTYVDWMNDIEVYKYLESGGDYTIEDLENYLRDNEEKDIFFWAIHLKASNKHIGNIKIDPFDEVKNAGEYGIMMGDKTEWGKGYAKEASLSVINFCFETLELKQITLGVVEKNISAFKLYEKIGFEVEKIIDDAGTYEGELCNSIRMVRRREK